MRGEYAHGRGGTRRALGAGEGLPVNSWDVGTGGYLRDVECGCERAKRGSRRAYRAPRVQCTGRNSLVEMNLAAIGFERRGKRPQTAGVVVRSGARALELNDAQIWNAVKVAHEE